VNNKPYAITLDVGSSLANKTGSWRTERAVYDVGPSKLRPVRDTTRTCLLAVKYRFLSRERVA